MTEQVVEMCFVLTYVGKNVKLLTQAKELTL